MAVANDNFNRMVKEQVGYSADELAAAFKLVEDKGHWKNPIVNKAIPVGMMDVVAAAIEFYTATKASFAPFPVAGYVVVSAAGYRAGPAGDH